MFLSLKTNLYALSLCLHQEGPRNASSMATEQWQNKADQVSRVSVRPKLILKSLPLGDGPTLISLSNSENKFATNKCLTKSQNSNCCNYSRRTKKKIACHNKKQHLNYKKVIDRWKPLHYKKLKRNIQFASHLNEVQVVMTKK